jgi:hypothetical protein
MNGEGSGGRGPGGPGGALRDLMRTMLGLPWAMQRTMFEMMFGPPSRGAGSPAGAAPAPAPSAPAAPAARVDSGRLNKTSFVALGEGLAAGAADFFLDETLQRDCFPAQMARQMQTDFPQALLQPPGIGNLPGYPPLPVEIPGLMQTTVLEPLRSGPRKNLSVPNYRLADALELHPVPPLVHSRDARQTACNLILGTPELFQELTGPLPTQLEAALRRRPTLALVALGYTEAIEAAVHADPALLPEPKRFRGDYQRLLAALRGDGSEVMVVNIPDPLDTACASTLDAAARIVKVAPGFLRGTWNLQPGDRVTVRGLIELGNQILSRRFEPLPGGCVVGGAVAARISARVGELNAELAVLARTQGASLCDLWNLFREVRARGLAISSWRLTADFLGGFYSLNGYYPGKTGHALIANRALQVLNATYGARFPLIDLTGVAATDPVVLYQPAVGPDWPASPPPGPPAVDLRAARPAAAPAAPAPAAASGAGQAAVASRRPGAGGAIELPPGLEIVLPLNKERTYYGDALRAVDCRDPREVVFGSCGGVLFGGLGLLDSHLSGQIRIRFAPPVNQISHFEVTIEGGLTGEDGTLVAPLHYKLPAVQNQVGNVPGLVSSGDVDLRTGETNPDTLRFAFQFLNSALLALIRVNPNFPQVPIQFPGQYGSAWARFRQRQDGRLDFEFFGTTFLPLGGDLGGLPVRFPLPFAGPSLQFASIVTRGLALHPHIYLSTCEDPVEMPEHPPEIPTNTVREYTFMTHNSSFGDAFNLTGPFLGGPGQGRSQLMGRLHVQFGARSGNTVPVYVSAMNPGGYLAPMAPSPLDQDFPGRLSPGPFGFNEFLRFPLRTYFLDDVFLLSDPFDLSVAAVDVRTGRVVGEQLHRGLIGQDVFFALLRVEPRTPKASFQFRGPAGFQKMSNGQHVYRFLGRVDIPYPEGFLFPDPNLATGFPAGPGSSLDPFFWVQGVEGDPAPPQLTRQGSANKVLASNGERFSYRYHIPADPARHRAVFEYTNHSQQGEFRLHSLTWVGFAASPAARRNPGNYDTVTFAGFGTWSKNGVDRVELATVQISTARDAPYVGIQIADGSISNVNTKPPDQKSAVP